MRKVTTINLNNNAYQIDEDGFDALRAYLERAERALASNPDREEILSDLEQAIADKCRLALGPHKTVVSAAEIERILAEMGPVAGGNADAAADSASGATASGSTDNSSSASYAYRPRRLYRIRDGQMWGGVCAGLAAYLGAEVGWLRLATVLLTVFTGFFPGLCIYVALVFILPVAMTPEEMSAAHGQPFNAQELVDRVKKKHSDFREERRARRHMRRSASWWSSTATAPQPAPGYAARVTGSVLLPVLTVLSALWFAAMAIGMLGAWWAYEHVQFNVWPNGRWFDEPDFPRWVALVAILAVYLLVAMPLGAGRRAALYYANGGKLHGWADAWSGLLWFALVAVLFVAAWYLLPQVQEMLWHMGGPRPGVVINL